MRIYKTPWCGIAVSDTQWSVFVHIFGYSINLMFINNAEWYKKFKRTSWQTDEEGNLYKDMGNSKE